ncbi:actin-related protein 8, partial [Anopheles darlingi]|uniref:actin-related protein 8 n=1 Tax=Anopheles darlingi TaxID=43151 RepID=UPI00210020A3
FLRKATVTGANKALPKTQKPCSLQSHPEDCFDAEYLRETGRRNKETLEHVSLEGAAENPEDEMATDGLEQERDHRNNDWDYWLQPDGQLVGLEQAIVQCVERCPSEELKRKMYGCILLVGGGMKFPGLSKWLQKKLSDKIPAAYRSEQCIVISPKEIDSEITSWKGAAIMSCLESASELWLSESEWTRYGWRALREKTVFLW